jgi:V/A-type H+-transporting ATPase subunit A
MIKIGILQQNSFDKIDTYCGPEKQLKLVKLMVKFYKESLKLLKEGKSLSDIRSMPIIPSLIKAKFEIPDEQVSKLKDLESQMDTQFNEIRSQKEEVELVV